MKKYENIMNYRESSIRACGLDAAVAMWSS
jgi:hypothetical protein